MGLAVVPVIDVVLKQEEGGYRQDEDDEQDDDERHEDRAGLGTSPVRIIAVIRAQAFCPLCVKMSV